MASARATIGGPFRSDLLKRTSARAAAFQSLTTVAHAEVAHTSVAIKVAPIIMRNGIGFPSGMHDDEKWEELVSSLTREPPR